MLILHLSNESRVITLEDSDDAFENMVLQADPQVFQEKESGHESTHGGDGEATKARVVQPQFRPSVAQVEEQMTTNMPIRA